MFGKKTEKTQSSQQLPSFFQALIDAAKTSAKTPLSELFSANPNRASDFCFRHGSLQFDFSKTHIDHSVLALFGELAEKAALLTERDKLLSGQIVNPTEQRPALHTSLRAKNCPKEIQAQHEANYLMAERVRSGEFTGTTGSKFKHIIHLGIGGSALGPQLLLTALGFGQESEFDTHCVANVDGHALKPAMDACDPRQTLVIVASKTFTTTETLSNARSLMQWMSAGGVSDPKTQMVAITAAPEKSEEFGITPANILTFPEGLGGRYSIWSAVSLVAMIVLGRSTFESFLQGAEQMDKHFAESPIEQNIPILAGMMDIWYGSAWGAQTRAQFAYDSRLGALLPYLQQLEMENNGKNVSRKGESVNWSTSPVLWGGVGTDAQHAVFQLLHQGTHLVPTEFVAVIKAGHQLADHHKCLLANCFAQGAALMKGRTTEEARDRLPDSTDSDTADLLAQSKTFSGNRPSTTILLDQLDAESFGALIAFCEHRSFVSGTLWQINVFDQMGVELGKELAKSYQEVLETGDFGSLDIDESTRNLLKQTLA